jgi:hypothetical protein
MQDPRTGIISGESDCNVITSHAGRDYITSNLADGKRHQQKWLRSLHLTYRVIVIINRTSRTPDHIKCVLSTNSLAKGEIISTRSSLPRVNGTDATGDVSQNLNRG